MAVDDRMILEKFNTAKDHVYNVTQQGQTVTLIKSGTKDELGEALTEDTLDLKAHPVRFTPFTRKVSQTVSWSEDCDILIYVSKKEVVDDKSKTLKQLKQYKKIRHDNVDYDIRYIDNFSSFFNDHLYIIIGAKK